MVFVEVPDVSVSGGGPQGDIHFGVGIDAVWASLKQTHKTPKKK